MKTNTIFFLLLLCVFVSTAAAGPVGISASASYNGGLSGSWSFAYTDGAPDLYLQKITIDLSGTDLRFDTWPGNFGSLANQDIANFSGTNTTTGLDEVSASGMTLDGGLFVSFSFNNFLPGMVFSFGADVDHPDPSLLSLQNCAALPPLARLSCNLNNAGRAATNSARLLDAEWVGPNDMAGAMVSFQFGGLNYPTRTINGTFGSVTLRDVIDRLLEGEGGDAFSNQTTAEAPEPATFAIFGAGLAALGLLRRIRR